MVARGVGRELAASVAAHRDILYRIQHPCGMIIPCFSPVVNTFFCGFGGSRNFRDIVTKTTGYSGVVWLKGRPGRHGGKGRTTRPAGGLPGWLPADLAVPEPQGWLAFFVARLPCLWFAFMPPSPRPPSPPGKGEIFCFLMQGASPLASPGLNPWFAAKPTGIGSLRVVPSRTCMAGPVSAASSLMQGCRGRSPRRNKLLVSPFPTGEGGWGDRGQKEN